MMALLNMKMAPLLQNLRWQKDVGTVLAWAAEPEMEERKLMGFKWIFVLSLALLQAAYFRRLRWSVLKSRKLVVAVANQLPSTFSFTSQSIPRWL